MRTSMFFGVLVTIVAAALPAAAQDHPSLRVGSALKLDFTARLDRDGRAATPEVGLDRPRFDWQSPRVGIEGGLFRNFTFEVSRDLGERSEWKDVYLNVRFSRRFQLEAGRFKVPFGRETLKGRPNLDFLYRSLAASTLAPGRDTGVMGHGRVADRHLSYQVGYFVRDGDNARTTQSHGGGRTAAARLIAEPHPSLQLGVAASLSRVDRRLGLRGQTILEDGTFFDRVYVNGNRRRIGLEAAWEQGPVSVVAERLLVSDERRAMGFDGEDLDPVRATGWYLAGTWALTGERKHGRIEPKRPLLRHRGIGAVEIAARLESLAFEALAHPGTIFGFPSETQLTANANRASTIGLNWYLDHYVRIQANIIVETVSDPQRSPAPTAAGRFVSTLVRLQFVL